MNFLTKLLPHKADDHRTGAPKPEHTLDTVPFWQALVSASDVNGGSFDLKPEPTETIASIPPGFDFGNLSPAGLNLWSQMVNPIRTNKGVTMEVNNTPKVSAAAIAAAKDPSHPDHANALGQFLAVALMSLGLGAAVEEAGPIVLTNPVVLAQFLSGVLGIFIKQPAATS